MSVTYRAAGFAVALTMSGGMAWADSVAPATYSDTLEIGESVTIKKTVTVDAGGPDSARVDVFFLADSTGSMGGQIAAAKANANTVLSSLSGLGDVHFGVGEYKDTSDAFTYRTNTALTGNASAVTAGINAWSARGGGDFPEGNLIGLERVAKETSWRTGSTRVVVMFGDAPGHVGRTDTKDDASGDRITSNETATIAALNAEGITVQIGNTGGTNPTSGMNRAAGGAAAGQANRIAAATGGEVFTLSSSGAGIADLIKDAVDATFAEYGSISLSPLGAEPGVGVTVSDPILGDFDREETRTFDFDVTFTGLEEGTHDFVIHALIDGGIVATETDRIVVGEGGEPGPGPDPGPGPGPAPIPLPAGLPLLLGALGGLGLISRRRKG